MLIYIVCFFALNCAAWIFFLKAFVGKYSPDKVLSDIRIEVDKLLVEISRETDRDISIIEERSAELKKLIKRADEIVALSEKEQKRREKGQEILASIQAVPENSQKNVSARYVPAMYAQKFTENTHAEHLSDANNIRQTVPADDAVFLKELPFSPSDITVSSVQDNKESGAVSRPEQSPEKTTDISGVPLPAAEAKPVSARTLKEKVLDLSRSGYTPAAIVQQLGVSMSEVSLVLDMFGNTNS